VKQAARGGRRRWRKLRILPGQAPGTLTPDPDAETTRVHLVAYGPQGAECQESVALDAVRAMLVKSADTKCEGPRPAVIWVNVEGLADIAVLEGLGDIFGIDRLGLEDVLNTMHRPKLEAHDGYDFLIARRAIFDKRFRTEQVATFFGPGFVLTFHEGPTTYLDPVRERIVKNRGKLRRSGSDYLAYSIVDCLVDHYFPPLTRFAETFADLDEELFKDPKDDFITVVRDLRASLVRFHGIAFPLVDVLARLIANPSNRVASGTRPYLRDCQDHVLQVIDQIDSFKQTSSDLMNQYHSLMTHKLNETMKVLTMIATIFIPLTFITSIYGMNFDTRSPWNMPELRSPYGYPVILGLMGAMTVAMLVYFRRNGWIRPFLRTPSRHQHHDHDHNHDHRHHADEGNR
jgi:magnesium transporter